MPVSSIPRLAALLTAQAPDLQAADLPLLEQSGMVGWVASRLPADHALRPDLEPARLGLLARQMILRRTLQGLLAAWNEAGVESVLLKGFMLAEFAYRVPGVRPYGDIDVLVRQDQVVLLVEVALRLGWHEDGLSRQPERWTHEVAHLFSPDGQVRLDVHRYVTTWTTGPAAQVERLTRAVWQASEPELLGGVPVRRPSWADCAMQLVLGRSWTNDRGVYKPADYTDLDALAGRPGVTRGGLARRAAELGAGQTWQAFVAGCDPWYRHFEYQSPVRARRIRWAALRDGAVWPMQRRLGQLRHLPLGLHWLAVALPDVLAVRLHLARQHVGPRQRVQLMGRLGPARPVSPAHMAAVVHGVRWLTRLLYPRSPGICVPRSLATYRALSRRGFPAVYVSGIRRTPEGRIEGHAWVEGPQGPLEEYGEPLNRQHYQTVFEERSGAA